MYTYTHVWWQVGVLGSLPRGLCWTSYLVSWGCRIYLGVLQRQEAQLKNVWLVFGTGFGATCSMPAYTPLHQTAECTLKFEMCLKCHGNKMVLWGRCSRSTSCLRNRFPGLAVYTTWEALDSFFEFFTTALPTASRLAALAQVPARCCQPLRLCTVMGYQLVVRLRMRPS